MKTSTAILLVGAAAVVALVLYARQKTPAPSSPRKGAADVLSGAFGFGTSLIGYMGDEGGRAV